MVAWFELAPFELDRGNAAKAADMAEVGLHAADCAADLIRATDPGGTP